MVRKKTIQSITMLRHAAINKENKGGWSYRRDREGVWGVFVGFIHAR